MMKWIVEFTKEAANDLKKLDRTQQCQIIKAIDKVSENPLPQTEGGYGKPLGNHISRKLAGLMKIKLLKLGLRIVYALKREDNTMKVVVISVRDDETVYKLAEKRNT